MWRGGETVLDGLGVARLHVDVADWVKRIYKSCSDDLQPGERIAAAMLLQPYGNSRRLAAGAAGGALGVLLASKLRFRPDGSIVSDEGMAAAFPDGVVIAGVTDHRVLVFGQAPMSGRPKELKHVLERSAVAAVELGRKEIFRDVTIVFTDGTGRRFESPGMDKSIEAFAAAFA